MLNRRSLKGRKRKTVFYDNLQGLESLKKNNSQYDSAINSVLNKPCILRPAVPNHKSSVDFPLITFNKPTKREFNAAKGGNTIFLKDMLPPERMAKSSSFAIIFSVYTEADLNEKTQKKIQR